MGFKLRREGTERDRFVLEGLYGQKSAATMFRTLEEARKNVEAARSGDRIGVILVPNDLISDNHGFWMYTARRGMEGYSLQGEHLAIACGRLPRE